MKFIRKSDWEDRLRTYLDRVNETPFKWGTHDCAMFAAGAVLAMTGVDPVPAFRDDYTDEMSARAALRAHGAGTLLKTMRSLFGAAKSVHQAKRGDIVMADRFTVGVCVGEWSWFAGEEHGREGLTHLPTRDLKYAFSIPFEGETEA